MSNKKEKKERKLVQERLDSDLARFKEIQIYQFKIDMDKSENGLAIYLTDMYGRQKMMTRIAEWKKYMHYRKKTGFASILDDGYSQPKITMQSMIDEVALNMCQKSHMINVDSAEYECKSELEHHLEMLRVKRETEPDWEAPAPEDFEYSQYNGSVVDWEDDINNNESDEEEEDAELIIEKK